MSDNRDNLIGDSDAGARDEQAMVVEARRKNKINQNRR